ncbi:MAG: hypothetical protein MJ123_04560 [Lachnospiraceae bacterium]|nr:hypothetical protein [Lachnospiraceae bacterium]
MANNSKTFSFDKFATSLDELKATVKSNLTDPFEVAALSVMAFCNYEKDVDSTVAMVNYLKGPQELSAMDLSFIKERLVGKFYVPRSFFQGTSPENDYQPSSPLTITVSDNPYSYGEENYVTLYLKSSGADSERPIKLRKKGDQWFLWQFSFLADIRKPAAEDPWA